MNMNIRDQFAMAAMQGLLASGESWSWNHNTIGRDSYDIADAMLVERAKNSPKEIEFDEKPISVEEKLRNGKIIRRKEVEQKTGLKPSSIYAMMAKGEFPKPLRISERRVAWREVEVDAWIAGLIEKHKSEIKNLGGAQ